MSANFPTSIDDGVTLPNPAATNKLNSPSHSFIHSNTNDAVKALESKVGTGATTPAANKVLLGTGAGTSAWQQLTSAELRGVLSDETGTGVAVFATTPTLTTPKVDTINEETSDNGVTIDGLSIKDGKLNTANSVTNTALAGSITIDKLTNPYKCSVYRNGNQNITDGANTKIQLNAESYDTNNNFDSTTNYQYTVPITGYYHITAQISGGGTGANYTYAIIYVNGVEIKDGITASGTNAQFTSSVNDDLYLTAGQYVELYAFSDVTAGVPVIYGGSRISFMSIRLISV